MPLEPEERTRLEGVALRLRERILEITFRAGGAHVGGALSEVELLVALYHRALRFDPRRPDAPDRDRFVLTAAARVVAPPAENVNLAHAIPPGWEGPFPSHGAYLLLLGGLYAGAAFALERIARRALRPGTASAGAAGAGAASP